MQPLDNSVPVVVLQPDHYGALCLERTLGRLGIAIYGVGANPASPGMVSRYCRQKFLCAEGMTGPHVVQFLHEISVKIGRRAVLTCTNDYSSIFIAENAHALRDAFLFPDVSAQLVRALTDKRQMYFLCKKFAVPTAETLFPQSRDEVLDFLSSGSARFPLMLKGIDGHLLERRGLPRMVIVRDPDELLECYDRLENPAAPNLMLQEYIPGGDDSIWMFNGYFNRESDCLLGFAGRKLRQYPVHIGATSLGICEPNAVVEKTTIDFMKAIGYRGVLDIGYRYDARDGQFKVLDINPRVGATFRLFLATNGMDVVRAMYLDLTRQPVPSAPACRGRKWVVEDNDLIAFRNYRDEGKLGFLEWAGSFRGVQEGAWFAPDDLVPFGHMLMGLSQRVWGWSGGKLRFWGLTRWKSPIRLGAGQ